MKRSLSVAALALFMLVFSNIEPALAQTSEEISALQGDVKSLKEGQVTIQKDLQEIKTLLQAKQAAQAPAEFKEAVINIQGAPIKGDKNAKLVLMEFSDYQCPFCSKVVRDAIPQIEKDYVGTGKMRHVFMNFPLPMHSNAMKASEAGLCAGDQGKFWEMHDKLFGNQQALKPEDLVKHAEALGLDPSKFKECLDSGKHAEDIKKEMAEGQRAGISGTPAFLIGYIEPDGKVRATKKVVGAQPYAAFKASIDDLLSAKK